MTAFVIGLRLEKLRPNVESVGPERTFTELLRCSSSADSVYHESPAVASRDSFSELKQRLAAVSVTEKGPDGSQIPRNPGNGALVDALIPATSRSNVVAYKRSIH